MQSSYIYFFSCIYGKMLLVSVNIFSALDWAKCIVIELNSTVYLGTNAITQIQR